MPGTLIFMLSIIIGVAAMELTCRAALGLGFKRPFFILIAGLNIGMGTAIVAGGWIQ